MNPVGRARLPFPLPANLPSVDASAPAGPSKYDPTHVKVGPGTLYAAPIGSVEPTSVSGAWPTGWRTLGYTEQGSEFDVDILTAPFATEEDFWPRIQVITGYTGKVTFILAETTRDNLALVMNAGITGIGLGTQGTNPDGSLWLEPPGAGQEQRVMLGWDYLDQGATTGLNPVGRLVVRQAYQTGTIKRLARKGTNKSSYPAEFSLEKPRGIEPFRWLFDESLAA